MFIPEATPPLFPGKASFELIKVFRSLFRQAIHSMQQYSSAVGHLYRFLRFIEVHVVLNIGGCAGVVRRLFDHIAGKADHNRKKTSLGVVPREVKNQAVMTFRGGTA